MFVQTHRATSSVRHRVTLGRCGWLRTLDRAIWRAMSDSFKVMWDYAAFPVWRMSGSGNHRSLTNQMNYKRSFRLGLIA